MEQLTTDESKKIELEILKSFKRFCNDNGLNYYLCGGTMIGAVRHSGFIPWDDDIDVIMPRPDYRRFIEIFPKDGINSYKLLSPYTVKDCCIVYSKLYDTKTVKYDKEYAEKYWKYGVDIDIFPTDGVPSDDKECERYFRKQYRDFHKFLALVGGFYFSGSLPKKAIKYLYTFIIKLLGRIKLLDANEIAMRINERAEEYTIEASNRIAISIFPHYGKKEIVDKNGFLRKMEMKFEDDYFTVPSNYDEYLTSLYGDYMKYPPIEKQVTHHLSDFYKKEEA